MEQSAVNRSAVGHHAADGGQDLTTSAREPPEATVGPEAPGETADLDEPDEHAIEAGRLLFAQSCAFLRGVVRVADLPPVDRPEVAFAGRSNVGKSSLINALTGRRTLARTSNTPGRTREINFFSLDDRLLLVDLPGYGYARAPKTQITEWTRVQRHYLKGRPTLRRLCLLVDARHGIKDGDRELMSLLDDAAVQFQIVLTKADKPKESDMAKVMAHLGLELQGHPAGFPEIIPTSVRTGQGIPALRAVLAALAAPAQLD